MNKNPRTPIPTKVYAEGWSANYLCRCSQCQGQFYGAKLDVVCPQCEAPAEFFPHLCAMHGEALIRIIMNNRRPAS